jgi:hypothetical protein
LVFGALAVAQDGLGGFLVAPEIGVGGAGFQALQAFAMLRGVKENSEPWLGGASGVRSGVGGLLGSWARAARAAIGLAVN